MFKHSCVCSADVLEKPRSFGRAKDRLIIKWYWENDVVSCKRVKFTS